MKRMNIIVDEELLERTRRASGEKTYSATIGKALEEYMRKRNFWEAYRQFEQVAHTEGVFDPEYLKEKMAKSLSARKLRVSAHEARTPRKNTQRRGSRR